MRQLGLLVGLSAFVSSATAEDVRVAGAFSNGILRFDAATGAVLSPLVPPGVPTLLQPVAFIEVDGVVLVADVGNGAVLEYDADLGIFLRVLLPGGTGGMNTPWSLAATPASELLVSSRFSDQVLRFDRATGAPLGVLADASDGLDEPGALLPLAGGDLLVASRANAAILRVDTDTQSVTPLVRDIAGTPVDESGGLSIPGGMTVGPDGDLYVSSSGNDAVLRYDLASGAFLGEFVTPGAGGLNEPRGLAFDSEGRLCVSSYLTHSIKRYSPGGAYLGDLVPQFAGNLAGPSELQIMGQATTTTPGDVNCDGTVTVSDIAPFVLILTDPAGYAAQFPNCDPLSADVSDDGVVSVSDIAPFVALLIGG